MTQNMKLPSSRTISNEQLSSIVEFAVFGSLADVCLDDLDEPVRLSEMRDSFRTVRQLLARGNWSKPVVAQGAPSSMTFVGVPYENRDINAIVNAVYPVAIRFFTDLSKVYKKLYARYVTVHFPVAESVPPSNPNINMVSGDIAARDSL